MAVILMIDDDREVLEINKKYLTGEGFDVSIASSAEQGIRLAKQCSPDCILLDVMMPDRNGYEVCHILRTFTSAPILFLTGKSSEDDKITGLTSGADDYIVKPYSLRELKARIDILLRRMGQLKSASDNHTLVIGNLTIEHTKRCSWARILDLLTGNTRFSSILRSIPTGILPLKNWAMPYLGLIWKPIAV